MLLSLSGFLFEDDYASQSVTVAEFCAIAKSAGYNGVELRRTQVNPDTPTRERQEILDLVRQAGLHVTCLTARRLAQSGSERDEFFLRYLELCRDMECRLLKIGSDAAWLRRAAGKARDYGVTLATNNHVGGPLETVEATRQYFREIAHPNMGLLYDSLHLFVNGEDYLGCIPEFAGIARNILVHSVRPAQKGEASEWAHGGRRWVRALPDESGVQDWQGICTAFKGASYDGLITVIENGWPHGRREYVARRCAEAMQHLWNEG